VNGLAMLISSLILVLVCSCVCAGATWLGLLVIGHDLYCPVAWVGCVAIVLGLAGCVSSAMRIRQKIGSVVNDR